MNICVYCAGPQIRNSRSLVTARGLSWAEACILVFLVSLQILHRLLLYLFLNQCATRLSVMASSSSFSFLVAIPGSYKSDLFRLLSLTAHKQTHHVNMAYGEFKTDLNLRCDSSTIIDIYMYSQVVLINFRVCCNLLPHNLYKMPQLY